MKIFIFGLGHLSHFLIKELDRTYKVYGTWRSPKEGFEKVESKIKFSVGDKFPEEIEKDYDWVIWSFPPVKGYTEVLNKANSYFNEDVPWVFMSSTSVYSEGEITEKSKRDGKRFRGENLIEIENFLYEMKRPVSIIRPTGLVDEKRNPANFFKDKNKKPALKGERLNLVHTQDVARFLVFLMENNLKAEDFILNSQTDIEKSEFYKKVLRFMGYDPIEFKATEKTTLKCVSSLKSRSFGFEYHYDDLLKYYKELASQVLK